MLDQRQPGWGGTADMCPHSHLSSCTKARLGVRGDAAPGVAPEPRVFISLLEPHEAASDESHTLLSQ